MRRNLSSELTRVTEAAALAAAPWRGKGNKNEVDQAAVDAMRKVFDSIKINGEVVIGEGEKDKAPMLYIGEKIGCTSKPEVDIAVDPVEGTSLVASGSPDALAIIAIAKKGNLLNAPDMYMEKIAVGAEAKGVININATVSENIKAVAEAKGKSISDITIVVLNRPRHIQLIEEIRAVGARTKLINDGDVAGGIATALTESTVDILMGIGGAPEGVLTAAALKCLGGEIQAQLYPKNKGEIKRAKYMGITNVDRVLTCDDLAGGSDIIFVATGITGGELLNGVTYEGDRARTYSLILDSNNNEIRHVSTVHNVNSMLKIS